MRATSDPIEVENVSSLRWPIPTNPSLGCRSPGLAEKKLPES